MTWLPSIFMMLTIFGFSSNQGEASAGQSIRVVEWAVDIVEDMTKQDFSEEERELWYERIHTPIRKMAHMAEYMIFAFTIAFPLYFFHNRSKKLILKTSIFCMGYAVFDEIHQVFVPGRAGKAADVLIDSIGIWLGIGIFMLGIYLKNIIQKKRERNICT